MCNSCSDAVCDLAALILYIKEKSIWEGRDSSDIEILAFDRIFANKNIVSCQAEVQARAEISGLYSGV